MEHNYINEIFERADLQQICEFFVSGLETEEPDLRPYGERLEESSLHIVNRMKYITKDEQEFSDYYDDFSEANTAYTKVFLEIGMKVGARLMFQLLYKD